MNESMRGKRWSELTKEEQEECLPMYKNLSKYIDKEDVIICKASDGSYYLYYYPDRD